MKYQIKSDKGYYSRSMSTGKAIFLDSSEMGYTFTKEEAERMLERLENETGKDLEIVEYKKENIMAKGGEIYNFDVYLYNDDEDRTIKEKKRYKVKASSRNSAYDKAKNKYPRPYFVELYSVDTYADGGEMSDTEWQKYIQPQIENLNRLLEKGSITFEQYQNAINNLKNPKRYADGGSVSDSIAMTILKQLGGMNRLIAMTGAYNFVDLGNGVAFKIKNQRANYIKIKLNSMDLYDLEVGRIRGTTYKVVATHKDVYFDQLKPLIEKATGMYLSLFAKGGKVNREENDVFDAYVPPTPEEKAAKEQKKQEQQMKMAKIAMMMAKDGAEISGFDVENLDLYEKMRYDRLISHNMSKQEALNVLINDVDGDYSQLSPELRKYAKKNKYSQGGITDEMMEAKMILGNDKWDKMTQEEKLKVTQYLIRKGRIEAGREEYEYDAYPYSKGGKVTKFQQASDYWKKIEMGMTPKQKKMYTQVLNSRVASFERSMNDSDIASQINGGIMEEFDVNLGITKYDISGTNWFKLGFKFIAYNEAKHEEGFFEFAKGGRMRFQDKVDSISKRLEGTKVPKRLRKDYGATYDKKESEMAAKRIVGSMRKKYE